MMEHDTTFILNEFLMWILYSLMQLWVMLGNGFDVFGCRLWKYCKRQHKLLYHIFNVVQQV
jgi:hypothetical protein